MILDFIPIPDLNDFPTWGQGLLFWFKRKESKDSLGRNHSKSWY